MGRCTEFGPQIQAGCSHAMVPDTASCVCPDCGAVCRGRFNGCPAVWARGPVGPATAPPEPVVFALARPGAPAAPTPDFSLHTVDPVTAPAQRIVPLSETAAARPVRVQRRARPAPRPARQPAPVRAAAVEPGLPGLRNRLDGLRGDLLKLGDTLGQRTNRQAPQEAR